MFGFSNLCFHFKNYLLLFWILHVSKCYYPLILLCTPCCAPLNRYRLYSTWCTVLNSTGLYSTVLYLMTTRNSVFSNCCIAHAGSSRWDGFNGRRRCMDPLWISRARSERGPQSFSLGSLWATATGTPNVRCAERCTSFVGELAKIEIRIIVTTTYTVEYAFSSNR